MEIDIYKELGTYNVLTYSRFENDTENPDFITGNQFVESVLLKTQRSFTIPHQSSHQITLMQQSTYIEIDWVDTVQPIFTPDSEVTQTIGVGSTSVGRVVSYDQVTGAEVLAGQNHETVLTLTF